MQRSHWTPTKIPKNFKKNRINTELAVHQQYSKKNNSKEEKLNRDKKIAV